MNTDIIAGIVGSLIGAIATLLAAWIAIRRQTTRKSDLAIDAYWEIFDALYRVRSDFATIGYLLGSEPGPTFAKDIVTAGRSFRDDCDAFQSRIGSHRLVISENAYDRASELISAASDLIAALNHGMSGQMSTEQIQQELNDRLGRFQEALTATEQIRKEWRRI